MNFGLRPFTENKNQLELIAAFAAIRFLKKPPRGARGGFVRCKGAALESCRCLQELWLPEAVES
jgi:hypothetical protein